MEKRIAVIFTGGTIGSSTADGVIDIDDGAPEALTESYRLRYGDERDFATYRPISVLSENITPYEFGKIVECVTIAANEDDVCGIVLTHGTDTLTFSANALSIVFSDIKIPVVLVSSDKPIKEGGNGVTNFKAAVDFISLGIPGVFVAYQNFREPMRIHLGSRLQETEQITGRVSSVCGLHFASYEGGRFVMNSNPGNVTLKELSAPRKPSGLKAVFSDVVAITAHTALDYGFYCCGGRTPAAYIIKLYHSGTCCNASGKYGAASFIERAKESGAEVVLAPFTGGTPYAGSAEIYKRALLAVDTSFEMCIAKVMLALGSGKDISEVLSENYAFEKLSKR